MSGEMIVRQCAPTLAGIKTGSLFPCRYRTQEELFADIRAFNQHFSAKGLRMLPFSHADGKALLYLYRPRSLTRDLSDNAAMELLKEAGYDPASCSRCVAELMRRFRNGAAFPHEVGLFLSYPPEDVKGFIDNRAGNCKCRGMWKVYGDEKKAKELFRRYRKCTEVYGRLWKAGSRLDRLAVSV